MKKLLPIPTIDHIPPYDRAEHLCDKMDKIFSEVQEEIIGLKHIVDPFACKSVVLDIFGQMVNANMRKTDSEDIKRHRIYSAIEDNKLFGTWSRVKGLVDNICGGDSKLASQKPNDVWMLMGDKQTQQLGRPTWACLGLDEQTAKTDMCGIILEGTLEGASIWQKGMFNIDTDNNHLTAKEVELLYENLFSSTPVGMTIGVGYMMGTKFVPYFVLGGINDTL